MTDLPTRPPDRRLGSPDAAPPAAPHAAPDAAPAAPDAAPPAAPHAAPDAAPAAPDAAPHTAASAATADVGPAPNLFARAIHRLRARLRIRLLRPEAVPAFDLRAVAAQVSSMPRRRLAGVLTLGVAGIAAGAVLVVLGVSAVSALSDQFGYHPRDEAAVWASLKPRFAVAGTCGNCHSTEGLKHSTSEHDVVPCQACHGPMEGHDQAGPVTYTALSELQTRELCAACHAKAEGRPKTIAQIDIDTHFTPGACALCHDPHTTNPVHPPKIPHTLDNLPACSVCHGSTGNRPVPATHPVFPSDVCQKCHAPLTPKA